MATPNSDYSHKTKGKRSAQNSPPGKKSKADEPNCLVCEPGEETDGYESLFCEGDCQGWIHRVCYGITCLGYDKLGESTNPFFCVHTVH